MSEENKTFELNDEELEKVNGGMGNKDFINIAESFSAIHDAARMQVEVNVDGQWLQGTIISATYKPTCLGRSIEARYVVELPDGRRIGHYDQFGVVNLRFIGE